AAELVEVDLLPLPAVLDPLSAMRDGAPAVLPGPEADGSGSDIHGSAASVRAGNGHHANVTASIHQERGQARAALERAPVRIERSYRIPAVHQGFLEPHSTLARAEAGDRFTVWTPTQGIFATRQLTADAL